MGNTAMDSAGKTLVVAGTGLVVYGVVGNVPPADYIGLPASAAMIGGLASIGFGAALSITSKVF